jgi:hypothetical protein
MKVCVDCLRFRAIHVGCVLIPPAPVGYHVGTRVDGLAEIVWYIGSCLVPQIAVIRSGVRDDISGIDYTVFVKLHTRCWTGVLDVERSEK